MDLTNIFTTCLGAALALLGSFFERKYSDYLNRKGKFYIYYRKVNLPYGNKYGWGFKDNCLGIPLYVDFSNTTNENNVVRDFALYLYHDKEKVKKLVQINHMNNNDINFGVVNDRYSFVVEPKSILSINALYMLKKDELNINDSLYKIKISYYDENNKKIEYDFLKIQSDDWSDHLFTIDEEWILLNPEN